MPLAWTPARQVVSGLEDAVWTHPPADPPEAPPPDFSILPSPLPPNSSPSPSSPSPPPPPPTSSLLSPAYTSWSSPAPTLQSAHWPPPAQPKCWPPRAPLLPAEGFWGSHCWAPAEGGPLLSLRGGWLGRYSQVRPVGSPEPVQNSPLGRPRAARRRLRAPGGWVGLRGLSDSARGAHPQVAGKARPTPGRCPQPRPRPMKLQRGKQVGTEDPGHHQPRWLQGSRKSSCRDCKRVPCPLQTVCWPAGPQAPGAGGGAVKGPSAPCSPLSLVLLGWPPLWGYPHRTPQPRLHPRPSLRRAPRPSRAHLPAPPAPS